MKQLTTKQKEEYNKFMNKQFKILQEHCDRCMQRILNKLIEIQNE